MADVRPDLERIWGTTRALEAMYREWNQLESEEWRDAMVTTAAFPAMFERHMDMVGGFDDETLKAKLASTADLMEAYAVLAFSRAAKALPDGAPDENQKINPYAISLDPDRWESDGLFNGEGLSLVEARQTPAAGMESLLMENIAAGAEATASRSDSGGW